MYQQALRNSINWREFYQHHFDLKPDQIDYAGSLWTQSQLSDKTPAPLFGEIPEILEKYKHLNHGIISQNSRELINKILSENRLTDYFRVIIGYEEVGIRKQKPDPAGLLLAIQKIRLQTPAIYIYIGDHETDILFARNVNTYFMTNHIHSKIYTIAALYQPGSKTETWAFPADFQAESVSDIDRILSKNSFETP